MCFKINGRIWSLLTCVFIVLPVVLASLENSPKIITKEGNVILEAGINKNITIRLNGRSRLRVNDFDLMDMLLSGKRWSINGTYPSMDAITLRGIVDDVSSLQNMLLGRGGLRARIQRLQNRTQTSNPGVIANRILRRLSNLEVRVQGLVRKLRQDDCKTNKCDNGGTCIDLYDSFMCKCTKGFEGPTCSTDVNECALFAGTDLGCQNGAQCINQFGSYSCICNSGWQGIHCSQRKSDCLHSSNLELCGHGTCVNSNDNFGYRCICEQGWKSNGLTPSCNVDVDECTEYSNPCSTKCINLPGGFMCGPCEAGYTGNGLNCKDIDECATENGGCSVTPFVPCINSYGSFHCGECPVGWTGDGRVCTRNQAQSCEKNNICHPAALCSEISNKIVCQCPVGFVGNGVGQSGCIAAGGPRCDSNPCLNGGTCVVIANGSYTCLCPEGFKPPNCERAYNPCATLPCRNGGTCRPNGLTFTCSCVTGYGGRYCESQRSRCGQYITAEQGNLKYPLQDLYNHNAQCSWVIRTNESKVLNITFSKFDIEDSVECRFDWLQMHDGATAASQLIGRFCGSTPPLGGNIITTTNRIYIWFKSDNSTSKAGFDLWWTSIDPVCGGMIEFDSHATIASPGSPGNYPRNRDCMWHLKAPNTKRIKLVFFSLKIEKHSDCSHDYLKITDAISDLQLEMFCNSSNPAPITMPSNEIFIHFHSDNEGSDLGFQIHASTDERIPGCGGTYTARRGQIVSPSGVEGPVSCEYTVRYAKGIKVQLEVTEFEMGSDDCIEIFDAGRTLGKSSVGRWCGKMTVPTYRSMSNEVQINYYSRGGTFKMSFGTICEQVFDDPSGVIISPNYPNNYPPDETCIYEIRGEPNQVVSLQFVDMDLETIGGLANCWFDYVSISDGTNETAAGPFCGTNIPSKIVSSTSFMKLTLRTDRNNAGRGFKANYTLISADTKCGGLMRKSTGEIRLPSSGGQYEHDLSCIWTIVAPAGFGVQLSWISFNLEESNDCLYDYVEIYDSDRTSGAGAIGKFCGSTMPPALVSATNVLTLKFTSDSTDAEDGFLAKYSFVDVSSLCGGAIYSSTGYIQSPSYPFDYPNDLNCSWAISVKAGHQIDLLVKAMDLEESTNCTDDWLEIRNGGFATSPLIGKYCGKTIPSRIPSFTHQIFVNFRTDHNIARTGFRMEWQSVASGCGGILANDRGSVASPFYPSYYNNDAQCEWKISVNKGSTIVLKFEDIAMESLLSCTYDFVDIYDGPTPDKRKIGRYCRTPSEAQIETTGNEALIRFQSDSSSSDRGFYLSYVSNCNRVLNDTHGAIESPNFGDNNPSEVNCSWTIQAPKGNRIFLEFAIVGQKDSEVKTDYLYYKEDENDTVTRISRPTRFESHGDTVQVWLNTSVVYFRMEYQMKGCIGKFHRPTGEFTSPGYPNLYPNNQGCTFVIEAELGKAIELVLSNLDIEESVNCTHDSVAVWSSQQKNHLIGRFCGKRDNITATSTGRTMLVEFNSDLQVNGRGFTASYKTIKAKCGGTYAFAQGTVHSPNYPNNYDSNLYCEWMIQVAEHSTMQLTIEELDLESSYSCLMDSLKIFDGAGTLWQTFCGDQIPAVNVFTTTSNTAMLVFDTDSDTEFKGFKVSFKENCGKRITVNDTGRIQFFGSDRPECLWVIVADDFSKHVTFTTTHVEIRPLLNLTDENCNGVQIFDGDYKNTSQVRPKKSFCSRHPAPLTSFGHALTIKLDPTLVSEFEGFYSTMDNNCGGKFTSLHGTFASPSYPIAYPLNVECIWEIEASAGNALSLVIQHLDIDKTDDCNADYLEVREGSSAGRLIGVLCGDDAPPPLVGQKSLWIKFNSDNDFVRKGFIAEYSYAFDNEVNGTEGTIESPRFPSFFSSLTEFTWRISVPRGSLILLSFENFAREYVDFMKIYNGYNDQAILIPHTDSDIIRSDTNNLFIKASKGFFKIHWYQVSKEFMATNATTTDNSSNCSDIALSVGPGSRTFQSPGYPGGYESNVRCSWIIIPTNPGSQAIVSFQAIDLEADEHCSTDTVEIYSSVDMKDWNLLEKKCKMKADSFLRYVGDTFLKVIFASDYGVNGTGFSATAFSQCGSTLTGSYGTINTTSFPTSLNCVWKIKVKSGRRIKITFLESVLMTRNDSSLPCRSFVMLKNGLTEHSPNLGKGKYCDNNIVDVPVTSSNMAYVKVNFERMPMDPPRISFSYEEVMNECTHMINLNEANRWASISSENYPNIPNSHTMCVWTISAPLNSAIRVDFQPPMELKKTEACSEEYVSLHDGSTTLAPLIGRFCGKSVPNSQHSSGNILRVTFFTDIAEPSIGFKANVSISLCGGTFRQPNGTISSPKALDLSAIKGNFSCDYVVAAPDSNAISLTVNSMDLPSSNNCSEVNHLVISSVLPMDVNELEPIIICGGVNPNTSYLLETNTIRISYRILSPLLDHNTFELSYKKIGHQCGSLIEAESGVLKSPGFLSPILFPTRCMWKIKVPKGRRIKLEFLEYNAVELPVNTTNRPGFRLPFWLVASNDLDSKSTIARFTENPLGDVYSSDNVMTLVSFELPTTQKQGFKIRFSSDEESLYCNANFDRVQGDIHFQPPGNTPIFCRYDIDVSENQTMALSVEKIESNSALLQDFYSCSRHAPLLIQDMKGDFRMHWFCMGQRNDSTVRLPYPVMFDILKTAQNNLKSLDLKFTRHNCGGVFTMADQFQLREPTSLASNYGVMDCAWKVLPNPGDLDQFEVSVNVDFKLKCDEQYLIVYSDATMNSPHLGRFCKQAEGRNLVATKGLFIEYHTANYERQSTFNLTAVVGAGCGGELSHPFRLVDFRKQYQNNVECVWTVQVGKEYHVGLSFPGRFFIESSPNCTKDYLLVQERATSGEWTDRQRICGREAPAMVNTTKDAMRLIFRSDDSGLGDGFTAKFERNCGGILQATKDIQNFSSPNYPGLYHNNLHCNYTVLPSEEEKVVLIQFRDFTLEDSPTGCEFDNLTVYVYGEEPNVLCGSIQRMEFRSTKPVSLVFKSDSSYNRKGFLIAYSDEQCGGVITNSTLIATPKQKADSLYPPNTVCTWNISAPEGSKAVVKFEEFEFEGSTSCSYDYVELYSGRVPSLDQRLAKLCGNLTGRLPPFFIQSSLGVIRSFSDQSEPSIGFSAFVKIIKNCDKNIELKAPESYTLSDFSSGYENNMDCSYVFKAAAGHQLVLEFSSFHVEEAPNCQSDYVRIHDGGGPFADEIGTFCGHTVPNAVTSSSRTMFLHFVSDQSETSSGFTATVRAIPLVCGAHELSLAADQSVTIKMEGEPNYLPNLNCLWHLRSNRNIHLDFQKLDIQGPDANGSCATDYVKVYNKEPFSVVENGLGSDIVFNGHVMQPFGSTTSGSNEHVFCGQHAPESFYTNNQDVYIKFSSDSTIEKTGFRILATQAEGCLKNYTATQGRILMETSADCNVYINAPQNYSISVYFDFFSFMFGTIDNCTSDFIEIFDESSNKERSIRKLCGTMDPSYSIFTESNMLRLLFSHTSTFVSYDLTFLASDKGPGCGGDLYNTVGIITSPFYPQNMRNNSDCRWNIRVPHNLFVHLEFKVFDLGSKVTCHSDFLQIMELESVPGSPERKDEVTRQFCGEDTPTTYKGRRNFLSIRYRKTVNYDGIGWVIRFMGVHSSYFMY